MSKSDNHNRMKSLIPHWHCQKCKNKFKDHFDFFIQFCDPIIQEISFENNRFICKKCHLQMLKKFKYPHYYAVARYSF